MENTKPEVKVNNRKAIMGELKKITWPTKKEMVKNTITVIVTCIIITIIIFAYDFSLNWLITQFHNIFGGW